MPLGIITVGDGILDIPLNKSNVIKWDARVYNPYNNLGRRGLRPLQRQGDIP